MGLKPMNCPAHIQIYNTQRRSHRDLPIRLAEQGLVHRHEPSGTLHGLLRVRSITQDDAHIFCTDEQIEERGDRLPGLRLLPLRPVRPRAAARALDASAEPDRVRTRCGTRRRGRCAGRSSTGGSEYDIHEGDGAFYGPKIDLHTTDSIGRSWQLGTVQLDYAMPERFDMTYAGADNLEHRPVMIHRALFGSFERFIGILIEHFAGEFPLWIAPVQAIVLPIADRHNEYGGVRGRADARRGPARRARRPGRIRRPQDPRRRAPEDPVHADRGRPRAGERPGGSSGAPPRRPGLRARSRT